MLSIVTIKRKSVLTDQSYSGKCRHWTLDIILATKIHQIDNILIHNLRASSIALIQESNAKYTLLCERLVYLYKMPYQKSRLIIQNIM